MSDANQTPRFRRTKRVAVALAGLLILVVALLALRWQLATQRIDQVATKAATLAATRKVAVSGDDARRAGAPARLGGASEAAGVAAMHMSSVDAYRERSADDRAALPHIRGAMDGAALARLQTLADAGNARAACILSAQATKCNFLPVVVRDSIAQLSAGVALHHERGSIPSPEMLRALEHSRTSASALARECAGAPAMPPDAAWRYLLQSALLGYEPAMLLFSQWPPVDFGEPNTSVDAVIAYLRYSGSLTEALAQRGDLNAITSLTWEYGHHGPNVLQALGLRALPADPTRALMYAYVREGVMLRREAGRPGSTAAYGQAHAAVERVLPAVDEAGRQWARQMADQMLATFTPDALRPSAPASEQAEEPTLWQQLEDICRE